jgi:hypothetical protein
MPGVSGILFLKLDLSGGTNCLKRNTRLGLNNVVSGSAAVRELPTHTQNVVKEWRSAYLSTVTRPHRSTKRPQHPSLYEGQRATRVLVVTPFSAGGVAGHPLPLPRLAELGELLPIADAKAVAGALDFLRKRVQGNTTATIGNVRAALEKQLTPAQLQALSVTREHVSSVRALLPKAGDSIPPRDTGLAPVVCAGTRECAWVCAGCSDKYSERGNACLVVKISLD